MQKLEFHPWAELFPLLEGAPFDELVEDIRKHGVREPIITYQGKLLDGRNRYRACEVLGLDTPMREYMGDAPLLYVLSLNLHRRHLDESQRAMIAAKIANLSEGRPSNDTKDAVSIPKAAQVMNVSRASIGRARKVLDKAAPEVVAAVEAGRVSVGAAAEVADAPTEEQTAAAKAGAHAIKKLATKRRTAKASPTVASSASSKLSPPPAEATTSHARAEPKRRALYLWREFVALKVTPAEFVSAAGRSEAASLTRSVSRFFLEVGRLARAKSRSRPRRVKVKPKAKVKAKAKTKTKAPMKARTVRKPPKRIAHARRIVRHPSLRIGA